MSMEKGNGFSKTRYLLKEALMRLLEKNSFRRIAVGDICREAMVSRSSFYGHFSDKYELLEYCLNEILEQQTRGGAGYTLEQKLLIMLGDIQDNSRTLHNIFMADIDPEIIQMFERIFKRIVNAWLEQKKYIGEAEKEALRMTAAFYAGGLANVVICWVREKFSTPKEEVARSQSRLLLRLIADMEP